MAKRRRAPGSLAAVDVNLIVALDALLRERNVTRAGRAIGLGQSATSNALARLREHFDDPLLVPRGRELQLSPRAEALVEPVRIAVRGLERVLLIREDFDPGEHQAVFRVATTDNLALRVLPTLGRILSREAPGVRLQVASLGADWTERLIAGDIDLKLGRRYAVPASLVDEPLGSEHLVVVCREVHAAADRLTLDDYLAASHVVVDLTRGRLSAVDAWLGNRKLQRRVAMTVPQFSLAPYVVARSDLLLTIGHETVAPFVAPLRLEVVPLPIPIAEYHLSMAFRRDRSDEAALLWLRAQVARAYAEER